MNVNGIPQINLFDKELKLETTFIGLQDEKDIEQSLKNLLSTNEVRGIDNPNLTS